MSEFVERMATQRKVLTIVNSGSNLREGLYGLSSKAIQRWVTVNNISSSGAVPVLLKKISSELFFLAVQSQEPISEEYKVRCKKINLLLGQLEDAVS